MINEIDILQNRERRNFSGDSGKQALRLLCIVTYHQKLVIELREYSFDSLTESFVSPYWRPPVFLIESVRHLKGYMSHVEKVLLDVSTEIPHVSQHQAIAVLPFDIIKIMQVMYVCRSHVTGMDNATNTTDCVEFIPVIMHILRCAIAPGRSSFRIVLAHGTTGCSRILTDLYWLGVNAENILFSVDGRRYVFTDFLTQTVCLLSALIILASGNKIGNVFSALNVQTVEQIIFTVYTEDLGSSGKCHYLQIGELGHDTSARDISETVYTISGKFFEYVEYFSELYNEVVHKRDDSNQWFGHH